MVAAARRRANGHNDLFYDEMDRDKREKKRRYRLMDAATEAFAHVQAVNTNNANFKVVLFECCKLLTDLFADGSDDSANHGSHSDGHDLEAAESLPEIHEAEGVLPGGGGQSLAGKVPSTRVLRADLPSAVLLEPSAFEGMHYVVLLAS